MGNGERINNRETLSQQAKNLGIDPRGMNAAEKKEAIAGAKADNEAKESMFQFVKDRLQLDAANNGGGMAQVAQPVPEVKVAPVVESTATTRSTELPVRTGTEGGGGLMDLPGAGTFVLGCVDGELQWLATSEC